MDTNGQTLGIPTSNDSSAASRTQNHSLSLSGREGIASGDEPFVNLQKNVEGHSCKMYCAVSTEFGWMLRGPSLP